ncbi:hypothetical protein ElyMa_003084500 [Elysia marginata]|uniref:Uncharacterized protein n=1 Tax=Elysia marginata TaxID=1093978 RepID=A0AAV4IMK6_9GAST|nr:hypothetical protein ElyMa_003084500 [Elysia marginata]
MTDLLVEIQVLNQVQNTLSDGSYIEDLDHFSNADDFPEDDRRYLNVIGRDSMDHIKALRVRGQAQDSGDGDDQDPELDAQPQVPPNCPDLNAQANWITENFVQRGELDCMFDTGHGDFEAAYTLGLLADNEAHFSFTVSQSRDRYLLIWRYLHLANNNLQDRNPDKLAKLRPMLIPVLVPSPSTQMGKDICFKCIVKCVIMQYLNCEQ